MAAVVTLPSGTAVSAELHEGTNPSLPPIVFIPGPGATMSAFKPVIRYLSDVTIVVFDLPGQGSSPLSPSVVTLHSLVQDIKALLTHFNIEGPITLVASAGGSCFGIEFAKTYPELSHALIIAGPPPPPSDAHREQIAASITKIKASGGEFWKFYSTLILSDKAKEDESLVAIVSKMADEMKGATDIMAACKEFDFGKGINENVKRGVVRGEFDKISSPEMAEAMAKNINGELIILKTGHAYALEDPAAFASAIKKIAHY